MNELDALLAKIANENRQREAKQPAPTTAQAASLAAFLRKWAKGKPIVRLDASATFWTKGKLSTKLTAIEVQTMVKLGLATVDRDPHQAGAILLVK